MSASLSGRGDKLANGIASPSSLKSQFPHRSVFWRAVLIDRHEVAAGWVEVNLTLFSIQQAVNIPDTYLGGVLFSASAYRLIYRQVVLASVSRSLHSVYLKVASPQMRFPPYRLLVSERRGSFTYQINLGGISAPTQQTPQPSTSALWRILFFLLLFLTDHDLSLLE